MFKKAIILILFILQIPVFANDFSGPINKVLSSFDFDRDSVVSISVKSKKTSLPVYEKNAFKYLNPASTLKLFTMAAALNTLGENYKFETAFYKDKKGNLYLKLSADPLLDEADLNKLAAELKKCKLKISKIYIDDSIIDLIPYPNGWTYDDFWPNSPKISPYMVNKNTVRVDFLLNEDKNDVRIIQKDGYKFSFVNKLIPSDKTNIRLVQDEIHNTVNVEGEISSSVIGKEIPVLNPKYFFCQKLNKVLNNNGIRYTDKFLFAKTPDDAVLAAKFSRGIDKIVEYTLKTSDNTSAEMIFKAAGAKYAKENSPIKNLDSFGTTENGINMFFDYFNSIGLDSGQIKIKDGSGVSRYNVMNVNWMTNALLKMNFDYEKYLPTGGSGTLSKRMRELEGCAYFKTGTLFGTSALIGVIKTGNDEYFWASNIMSYNRNKSLIKGVEDEMVYEVYRAGNNEEN